MEAGIIKYQALARKYALSKRGARRQQKAANKRRHAGARVSLAAAVARAARVKNTSAANCGLHRVSGGGEIISTGAAASRRLAARVTGSVAPHGGDEKAARGGQATRRKHRAQAISAATWTRQTAISAACGAWRVKHRQTGVKPSRPC